MTQYLPDARFKWLNQKQIDKSDVNSFGENSPDGYILEVGLEYLDELHELDNDYPLAPEKLKISHDILSKYCSNIANNYNIKIGNFNKLVPHLGDKSKYILHYGSFQLYLSLELKLIKIRRILEKCY